LPPAPIADLVPVILAGGSGTRLWPASRASLPKHLVDLFGAQSLLQTTARRITAIAPAGRLVTVAAASQGAQVRRQLASLDPALAAHLLLEPEGRNTAAAVALAALYVTEVWGPEALLWICPSDHLVTAPEPLYAAVAAGAVAARAGRLVTFGITATRPETGYGYIEAGPPLAEAPGVLEAKSFVEKPVLEVAQSMLEAGGYSWNSGMFLLRASAILDELEAHAPPILAAVRAAMGPVRDGTSVLDPAAFAAVPAEPIDKAVMERSGRVAVVPCAPGWSDVGSWHAIWEIESKDADGNALGGDARVVEGRGNLVKSESRLVALAGVDDLAVIETADAVLVARRLDSEAVKALVGGLLAEGRSEAVRHRHEPLRWGVLTRLVERPGYALRELQIDARAAVELDAAACVGVSWTVVEGTLELVVGDAPATRHPAGARAAAEAGVAHRLVNAGTAVLRLVEVRLA
jgi:mannose-1-phosphate guanylyltransferase / mannose-6-phosphate isomerase